MNTPADDSGIVEEVADLAETETATETVSDIEYRKSKYSEGDLKMSIQKLRHLCKEEGVSFTSKDRVTDLREKLRAL